MKYFSILSCRVYRLLLKSGKGYKDKLQVSSLFRNTIFTWLSHHDIIVCIHTHSERAQLYHSVSLYLRHKLSTKGHLGVSKLKKRVALCQILLKFGNRVSLVSIILLAFAHAHTSFNEVIIAWSSQWQDMFTRLRKNPRHSISIILMWWPMRLKRLQLFINYELVIEKSYPVHINFNSTRNVCHWFINVCQTVNNSTQKLY